MILCDGHVHLHHGQPLSVLLDVANLNFGAAAGDEPFTGVLWLTESSGVDRFSEFRAHSGQMEEALRNLGRVGKWTLSATRDEISIEARNDAQRLLIIAGRQIATKENLEILALGTRSQFKDGEPFDKTMRCVIEDAALPVIPWGFGKWLGKRGRIVANAISTYRPLFLGDNGGRLAWSPRPKLFESARHDFGLAVLPGSDPLPIANGYLRTGSYGWRHAGSLVSDRPGLEMKKITNSAPLAGEHFFGRLEKLGTFVRNQIRMQLYKRSK